jgi:uncharacterized repeat protein (TIGR03803 family)
MKSSQNKVSQYFPVVLAAFVFAFLTAAPPALAQTETVLYSFCSLASCADGSVPESQLTKDAAGNLYGTTYTGGAHNSGTVFKLDTRGVLTVLYSFGSISMDGFQPMGELVRDARGNLYGTTVGGGAFLSGTVFEVSPQGNETIVHSFGDRSGDGLAPEGGLTIDASGTLYGTTPNGGKGFGAGTVFEVSPQGAYSILHHFVGSGDGLRAVAPVTVDQSGNLYGTTELGGTHREGTVFKMSSGGKDSILLSFSADAGAIENGVFPQGGVVKDAQGNIYGTTYNGGAFHYGALFKLSPSGTETVLHSFGGSGDGLHTQSGLVIDAQGNLYGTCFQGGTFGAGVLFKVTPDGTETILHNFSGGPDGAYPHATMIRDLQGNLYGTTEQGGTNNQGTIFEVTP